MSVIFKSAACAAAILVAVPAVSQNANGENSNSSIREFDEVVVTGSPLTRSVDEAITGLSVLSGEELINRGASTLGETLKYEAGVSSTQFGAGASRPIIRGQGGDRVRVLNNGIGSIDASSASPDHAVAAEPAQAERIEVLRGAALLRYGSSGSGGVVNVIDGRIPDSVPEDGVDGAVRFGGSSVDSGYEGAGSVDIAAGERIVLHFDATYREADDYDIPGFAESAALRASEDHDDHDDDDDDHEEEEEVYGTLENSALTSQSATFGASYILPRGHIGFAVQRSESDYGIPAGHAHEEDHEDEDHEDEEHEEEEHEEEEASVTIGLEQTRFDVNAAYDLDGFFERVQLFGGYADYAHTEFEGDEVGTVFSNEGYEIRAEAIQAEQNGWAAAYGLSLRSRKFSAIGDEAFVPPTETFQTGLFSFHEIELDDVHIEGAARIERTSQDNSVSGEKIDFDTLSLSAGADIHLSDQIRLGGTVFRTQRAPSTEELYSDGPHLATGQYELGDPDLDIETASGIELALRHREDGHYVSANVFYTAYSDYIFERATDAEIDELTVYEFTADDASFAGFELQGGAEIGAHYGLNFSVDGQAAYVRAQTDAGNLPRIPPLSVLLGVEAKNDHYSLRAEADFAAESDDIAQEETATESYALLNLFATWHVPLSSHTVSVTGSVQNAFDDEARQHTSFLKDEVPLPGRNFKLSVNYQF